MKTKLPDWMFYFMLNITVAIDILVITTLLNNMTQLPEKPSLTNNERLDFNYLWSYCCALHDYLKEHEGVEKITLPAARYMHPDKDGGMRRSYDGSNWFYYKEPAPSPVVEEWPKYGDEYFYVSSIGKIMFRQFIDSELDEELRMFGNCFRTQAEAEEKLAKIIKVLGE